jgi:hypothetical protein
MRTEAETRELCTSGATEIIENLRRSNAEYCEATGYVSTVSEADYARAQEEIERAMLRIAGLDKAAAK